MGREVEEMITEILRPLAIAARNVYLPETDRHGNPVLGRFFFDNGRLPHASDDVKPWSYRGWLIPYRQMAEAHPDVPPRYDYVMRTLDAGQLLGEPIPQISFVSEHSAAAKKGMKLIADMIRIIEYRSASWNNFRECCEWLGFALGVSHERSTLPEETQEQLYRQFTLEHWLIYPTDYLGQQLCEVGHGKGSGFFPTPMSICEVMAQMTFHDEKGSGRDLRIAKTVDCAVGTGRTLLAASNYTLRLYGQDIDPLCCLITKINLALYAPWFFIPDSLFPAEDEIIRNSMRCIGGRYESLDKLLEDEREILANEDFAALETALKKHEGELKK